MTTDYSKTIERVYQLFRTSPDPNRRENGEGWSVKEILGHLVDSASNNHQRLVRYVPNGTLAFPGYDQELSVLRAGYRTFDFDRLIALWYTYNHLLLHLIAAIPSGDLESTITVGERPPVTIRQLVADYFSHMENHERQALRIIGG
jgi:hypothetical protein